MKSCSIVPYEESIRELTTPGARQLKDSSDHQEKCIILRYIRLLQCIVHCTVLWLQPLQNKHKYFSCTKYFRSHLAIPLDMQYIDSFGFISVLTLRPKKHQATLGHREATSGLPCIQSAPGQACAMAVREPLRIFWGKQIPRFTSHNCNHVESSYLWSMYWESRNIFLRQDDI